MKRELTSEGVRKERGEGGFCKKERERSCDECEEVRKMKRMKKNKRNSWQLLEKMKRREHT